MHTKPRLNLLRIVEMIFFAMLVLTCAAGVAPVVGSNEQQDRQLIQEPAKDRSKRVALVIGNGTYTNAPPLKNPSNDASLVATTLRKLGFDVSVGTDRSQREMKQLIRQFGQTLRSGGGVGLFYYAGHGVQSKGRNYLVPIDADIQGEADLEDIGVDVNYVLGMMDDAQNSLNIVILDACRNNPFGRGFRSAQGGLAQVKAPTGTLIAYATSPDSTAADGDTGNSPYTEELVRQMQTPGVVLETMFRRVTEKVSARTAGRQEPWVSDNHKGDFYFNGDANRAGSSIDSSVQPGGISEASREQALWDAVKDGGTSEDLKEYLAKYPNGAYSNAARVKLRRLEKTNESDSGRSQPEAGPGTSQFGAYTVSGGILNDKATSLPQPAYPAIAAAARASGVVTVEVTIDQQGAVISARATSGHTLLLNAAVQAARQARFQPTLLKGHPVKVVGIINYNFVLPKPKENE